MNGFPDDRDARRIAAGELHRIATLIETDPTLPVPTDVMLYSHGLSRDALDTLAEHHKTPVATSGNSTFVRLPKNKHSHLSHTFVAFAEPTTSTITPDTHSSTDRKA